MTRSIATLTRIATLYPLQALNYVFTFLTIPYLSSTLGLHQFGAMQVAVSLAAVATIVTDWGFSFTATRAVAQVVDDKPALTKVASTTLAAKMLLFILVLLAAGVYIAGWPDKLPAHALEALLLVLTATLMPTWLCQGLGMFHEVALTNAIVRAATTALLFLLVHGPEDVQTALLITSLNSTLVLAWLWFRAVTSFEVGLALPNLSSCFRALNDGRGVFATTLVTSLYTSGGTLVVGALGGVEAAGAYAAVDRIVAACKAALSPLVQVMYTKVAGLQNPTRAEFISITRAPFIVLFVFMVAVVATIWALAPLLFGKMMGVPMSQIDGVLVALLASLPAIALAHWFVTVGLLARGLGRAWSLDIFTGAAIGLGTLAVLLPSMRTGLLTPQFVVASSVLATELCVLSLGFFLWRKSWR